MSSFESSSVASFDSTVPVETMEGEMERPYVGKLILFGFAIVSVVVLFSCGIWFLLTISKDFGGKQHNYYNGIVTASEELEHPGIVEVLEEEELEYEYSCKGNCKADETLKGLKSNKKLNKIAKSFGCEDMSMQSDVVITALYAKKKESQTRFKERENKILERVAADKFILDLHQYCQSHSVFTESFEHDPEEENKQLLTVDRHLCVANDKLTRYQYKNIHCQRRSS